MTKNIVRNEKHRDLAQDGVQRVCGTSRPTGAAGR